MGGPRSSAQLVSRFPPAWLVLAAVVVGGCKSSPPCPTTIRTDPGEVLADHHTERATWNALKAEARVTQRGSRGRIRGTVLMFLEQPDRVRFDVMTQVGPVLVLTSDGETFQLSDLRAATFLHGATCPQNVARVLGVSIPADQVLRILTGETLTIDAIEQSMQCRDGQYVVTLLAADGSTQEVAFSIQEGDRDKAPGDQRLNLRRSMERAPDGTKRWEATYDDYIEVDGRHFPTSVLFVDERDQAETAIRVKSIELEPVVPEGAFHQEPAPGMTIELADCP